MHRLTRFMPIVASVTSAVSVVATLAASSAHAVVSSPDPFKGILRVCDFTNSFLPGIGYANGYSIIGSDGATAIAEIHLFNAAPDTYYGVRFIELPRPVLGCSAGDPGVVTGSFVTDYRGDATLTLAQPVISGATKAWVLIEGPPNNAKQIAGDFYSSDFAASI